jgi:predicted proteasome-type protease
MILMYKVGNKLFRYIIKLKNFVLVTRDMVIVMAASKIGKELVYYIEIREKWVNQIQRITWKFTVEFTNHKYLDNL